MGINEGVSAVDALTRITTHPDLAEALRPPYVLDLLRPLQRASWVLEHSREVALINGDLYSRLKTPTAVRVRAQRAGLIHDVGKWSNPAIPLAVLQKLDPLTEAEREGMNTHAKEGYERIKEHDPHIAKMVLTHINPELLEDGDDPELLRDQRLLVLADQTAAILAERRFPNDQWPPEKVRDWLGQRFMRYGDVFTPEFLDFAVASGIKHVRDGVAS